MASSDNEVKMMLSVVEGTSTGFAAMNAGLSSIMNVFNSMTRAFDQQFGLVDAALTTTSVLVTQLGADAMNAFGQFEQGMKIVQMVSNQTSQDMDILKQKANEFSVEYRMDIDQLTEGLQTLGRAGLNSATEQAEVLENGLYTAKLEGRDLNSVLQELLQNTTLLGGDLKSNEFGEQTQYVNDLLVATSMTAPITTHDISETLKYSGGIAAAAGAKIDTDEGKAILEDYMGAIAAFAQKGVSGSIAGTALRAFLNKPATQDSSVVDALSSINLKPEYLWEEGGEVMKPISQQIALIKGQMEELNVSTMDQLQIWSKIVGGKMGQQMMKLDAEAVKDVTKDIQAADSASNLAAGSMKTYEANIKAAQESAAELQREVGEKLVLIANPLLEILNKILSFMNMDIASMPLALSIVGFAGYLFTQIRRVANLIRTEVTSIMSFLNQGIMMHAGRHGFIQLENGTWVKSEDGETKSTSKSETKTATTMSGFAKQYFSSTKDSGPFSLQAMQAAKISEQNMAIAGKLQTLTATSKGILGPTYGVSEGSIYAAAIKHGLMTPEELSKLNSHFAGGGNARPGANLLDLTSLEQRIMKSDAALKDLGVTLTKDSSVTEQNVLTHEEEVLIYEDLMGSLKAQQSAAAEASTKNTEVATKTKTVNQVYNEHIGVINDLIIEEKMAEEKKISISRWGAAEVQAIFRNMWRGIFTESVPPGFGKNAGTTLLHREQMSLLYGDRFGLGAAQGAIEKGFMPFTGQVPWFMQHMMNFGRLLDTYKYTFNPNPSLYSAPTAEQSAAATAELEAREKLKTVQYGEEELLLEKERLEIINQELIVEREKVAALEYSLSHPNVGKQDYINAFNEKQKEVETNMRTGPYQDMINRTLRPQNESDMVHDSKTSSSFVGHQSSMHPYDREAINERHRLNREYAKAQMEERDAINKEKRIQQEKTRIRQERQAENSKSLIDRTKSRFAGEPKIYNPRTRQIGSFSERIDGSYLPKPGEYDPYNYKPAPIFGTMFGGQQSEVMAEEGKKSSEKFGSAFRQNFSERLNRDRMGSFFSFGSEMGSKGIRSATTGLSGFANKLLNATDMVGGPFMIAMMAIPALINMWKGAFEDYCNKLKEAGDRLSDAYAEWNTAEDNLKQSFRNANPDATDDEIEQMILDTYSTMGEDMANAINNGTEEWLKKTSQAAAEQQKYEYDSEKNDGSMKLADEEVVDDAVALEDAIKENTGALYVATGELNSAMGQYVRKADDSWWGVDGWVSKLSDKIYEDPLANLPGGGASALYNLLKSPDYQLPGFGGVIAERQFHDEAGIFGNDRGKKFTDTNEFLLTPTQADENYQGYTEMAGLMLEDFKDAEGDWRKGLKTMMGTDADVLNNVISADSKKTLESIAGRDSSGKILPGSIAGLSDANNLRLQQSMKNDQKTWKSLAKELAKYENKNQKTYARDGRRDSKKIEGLINKLNASMGSNFTDTQILQAAYLQQMQDMYQVAQNVIVPIINQNMQTAAQTLVQTTAMGEETQGTGSSTYNTASIASIIAGMVAQIAMAQAAEATYNSILMQDPGKLKTVGEKETYNLAQQSTDAQDFLKRASSASYSGGYTAINWDNLWSAKSLDDLSGAVYGVGPHASTKAMDSILTTFGAGLRMTTYGEDSKTAWDKVSDAITKWREGGSSTDDIYTSLSHITQDPQFVKKLEEAYLNADDGSDGGSSGSGSGKGSDKDKDQGTKKERVDLVLCNKKEIPKLNVNLFKKAPSFTILNKNFKLRDIKVNTQDKPKAVLASIKNAIIDVQKRTDPKIIQDEEAIYDPVGATDGNTPSGTSDVRTNTG